MRSTFFGLLIACLMAGYSTSARAGDATAIDVVETFHSSLISIMKGGKKLGFKGRYEKTLNHIDEYFHVPLMVRFVTGNHWNTASRDEQIAVIGAARRLSAAELAVFFSDHSGESFETKGTKTIKDQSVLVETSLVRPNNDNVKIIYRTRKFGESWRIIDVILDGSISQLLKRRGEYNRTLKDGGIPALRTLLANKADEILKSE